MDNNDILWNPPSANCLLDWNSAHVWAVSLQVSNEILVHLEELLDGSERQRADRFHFERDRHRFIVGRAALRKILASYLREAPARIPFDYSSRGKPSLGGRFAQSGIHFNLAHCENLAVLAVARQPYIGIDLERVRPLDGVLEMAPFFCSARESAQFQSTPLTRREEAFFRIWTRKEALLKATGKGIGDGLDRVEVTFLPEEPPRLVAAPDDLAAFSAQWTLQELTPAPGFIAALAFPSRPAAICCWQWKEEDQIAYA